MSGASHEDVLCEDGTIDVRREHGATEIALTIQSHDDAALAVTLTLSRKQQQALREAVRAVQTQGIHRWP